MKNKINYGADEITEKPLLNKQRLSFSVVKFKTWLPLGEYANPGFIKYLQSY